LPFESRSTSPAEMSASKFPHRRYNRKTKPNQIVTPTRTQESVDNSVFRLDTVCSRDRVECAMPTAAEVDRNKRHRQRIRAAGGEEVLVQLPRETVAMLDELKRRQGLRSRSQVLLQLIEHGRAAAQQMT